MASKCFFLFFFLFTMVNGHLKTNFYSKSCPQALFIINNVVNSAIAKEQRMGASLLRLHFHDCFVNGCDGSVLLDDTIFMKGEKYAFPNFNSLRGYEVVDEIKFQLEQACPGVVSCADILAVAARDSVVALGGGTWTVLLGRRDSNEASAIAANLNFPTPNANLRTLISLFQKNGLNPQDLVVLSGAHTIGQASCNWVHFRLLINPRIDPELLKSLKAKCFGILGIPVENNLYPMDETPNSFDNTFFKNLVDYKGVLFTDQELYGNTSIDSLVVNYSNNSTAFFDDFGKAMIKMGEIGVLTGRAGEIRRNCRKVNES